METPEKKPNSEFQTPVYRDPITWIGFLWQWCLPFPHIRLWWILSQLTVDASETSGVVNELKSWGSSLVIWCLGLSAYTTVLRFNPWSGNFDPTPSYCTPWPKKKKKKIWNIACFVHKRFLYIILPVQYLLLLKKGSKHTPKETAFVLNLLFIWVIIRSRNTNKLHHSLLTLQLLNIWC